MSLDPDPHSDFLQNMDTGTHQTTCNTDPNSVKEISEHRQVEGGEGGLPKTDSCYVNYKKVDILNL
jgi:hypothetical protein